MLMLKRHMILKQDVDDYADSIQKLSDRAQRMLAEEHPDGWVETEPLKQESENTVQRYKREI